MRNHLRTVGIVAATVAACAVGAIAGTTGVILWSAYDVWKRNG